MNFHIIFSVICQEGFASTYNAFEIEKSLLKRKKATFRFYFILFLCICIPAAAVVCVTLIDRLKGDQLNTPTEILRKWEQRPFTVIVEFIKEQLKISSWKNGDASWRKKNKDRKKVLWFTCFIVVKFSMLHLTWSLLLLLLSLFVYLISNRIIEVYPAFVIFF